MNRKKLTALMLSAVMAVTPAAPIVAAEADEFDSAVTYTAADEGSTDIKDDDVVIAPKPDRVTGWDDTKTYYYVNGKKVKGKAQKIGKYTYCFAKKTGKLVKSKSYYTFDSKTYYRIDTKGRATKLLPVEVMAVKVLTSKSIKGDLRKAFNWCANLRYVSNFKVSKKSPGGYGLYGFQKRQGDCYVQAATFYWIAKVAGYDAHYVRGYFRKTTGKGPHAWVEIDYKGKTYVYDPNFQKECRRNGYKLTYGAKGTLKYVNYKRLN